MSVVNLNLNNFPIVTVSTSYENLTEQQVEEYLSTMLEFYKNNQVKNIVVIYEISILKAIDAKSRIKIGEWLKINSQTIKSAVKGVCYVQKNAFQKLILQGIFSIKTPEWPHKVVTSLEEGIIWGKELINSVQ